VVECLPNKKGPEFKPQHRKKKKKGRKEGMLDYFSTRLWVISSSNK
jgi:hypothetical protein